MELNFKDNTSASIRRYVHKTIDEAMAKQGMTPEVLADHSGVKLRRVVEIVYNNRTPEIDEAYMMFAALGIPLDHLTEHVKALPYFKRKDAA